MNAAGEWSLSPCFDLCPSSGPGGEHSTSVLGEGRNPTRVHCLAPAAKAGLRPVQRLRRSTRSTRQSLAGLNSPRQRARRESAAPRWQQGCGCSERQRPGNASELLATPRNVPALDRSQVSRFLRTHPCSKLRNCRHRSSSSAWIGVQERQDGARALGLGTAQPLGARGPPATSICPAWALLARPKTTTTRYSARTR